MARSTNPDPHTEAMVKRLEAIVERTPELAEAMAFYREVLPRLRKAQMDVVPFTLAPEAAQRKLAAGLPLLVNEDLPLDVGAMRTLFIQLCRIAESLGTPPSSQSGGWSFWSRDKRNPLKLLERAQNGDGGALRSAAARQLRRAVERNALDLLRVWEALAIGDWRRVELMATGLQLDPELLRTLAQNSLKPALRVWAEGLSSLVNLDHWQRGQCPLCGSSPLFAEIQGKEGARRLRCGMCGAGWYFPRLQCAFCGNQDYKTLGTISIEGEEEKYRLQTCERCRGYLKIVVTYDPTPVDLLPVEDLATLHLDLIAAESEYVHVPVQ